MARQKLRELHGDKRVYRTNQTGHRVLLLTQPHFQQMVNQKSNTPFAQRNFLNTIRAMFKRALAEDRLPDNPTVGVTRRRIETQGYLTWSDENIAQELTAPLPPQKGPAMRPAGDHCQA